MFHKENPDYNRKQVGFYTLDDLIPADHLLRQIDRVIDFSFIYDLVEDTCSHETGRPSLDPMMVIKIPLIQCLFGIHSMRQTIKEIEVNVAYRWFLGLTLPLMAKTTVVGFKINKWLKSFLVMSQAAVSMLT